MRKKSIRLAAAVAFAAISRTAPPTIASTITSAASMLVLVVSMAVMIIVMRHTRERIAITANRLIF